MRGARFEDGKLGLKVPRLILSGKEVKAGVRKTTTTMMMMITVRSNGSLWSKVDSTLERYVKDVMSR